MGKDIDIWHTRLKNLFEGVTDQLAAALAPAIELVADLFKDKLKNAIEDNGGSVKVWARNVVADVLTVISMALGELAEFSREAERIRQQAMSRIYGSPEDIDHKIKVTQQAIRMAKADLAQMKADAKKAGQNWQLPPGMSGLQGLANMWSSSNQADLNAKITETERAITGLEKSLQNLNQDASIVAPGTWAKPTNQVAGVVHGGEFVINAAATKRWRGVLDAINNGGVPTLSMAGVQASNGSNTVVKAPQIVNHFRFDGTYHPSHKAMVMNAVEDGMQRSVGYTIHALHRGL